MTALPTRKDEAWRYSDLAAVEAAWPLPAPEAVVVPAGGRFERAVVAQAGVMRLDVSLGKGARADITLLNAAEGYARVEIHVTCHEGADFALGAVLIGGGSANLELVTSVTHLEPSATSAQTVRIIGVGAATCTFLGTIKVAPDAQETDAEQSVKAMLLSPTATITAVPQLEIDADDVKCAHGCAIGQLDDAALFYAAARGLDPASAKRLLLGAFVAEVLGDDAGLRDQAQSALEGLL